MPRQVCDICQDYLIDQPQCSMCKGVVHLFCCNQGHRVRCQGCGFDRTRNVMCRFCNHCPRCCGCWQSACLECYKGGSQKETVQDPFSILSRAIRTFVCKLCHCCSSHCSCPELRVNKARAVAKKTRATLDRFQQRIRLLAEEDQNRGSSQGERAIFIPASRGVDFFAPIQLSSVTLTHLYDGAKFRNGGKRGIRVSGLPSQFKQNKSRRFLAPEIEVAKGNQETTNELLKNWLGRVVPDGSLTTGGFELNVSPTQGDLFIKMVEEVCERIEKDGGGVDKSCGLHCHVDARDFDYGDIRKLVFLYELVEPAIFACLPTERQNNRYCLPCGFKLGYSLRRGDQLSAKDVAAEGKNKYNPRKPVHSLVFGKTGRVSTGTKYGSGDTRTARYMGLNLYSWFYRNSVEFRHRHGTVDPQQIIGWCLMCAGLLDTAMEWSERRIQAEAPVLWEIVQGGTDLYKAAIHDGVREESLITPSTNLLKKVCQEQCWPIIDELQRASRVLKEGDL